MKKNVAVATIASYFTVHGNFLFQTPPLKWIVTRAIYCDYLGTKESVRQGETKLCKRKV